MFVQIKVYAGKDDNAPLYELATATDMVNAEIELAAIGRHIAKDVLRGKYTEDLSAEMPRQELVDDETLDDMARAAGEVPDCKNGNAPHNYEVEDFSPDQANEKCKNCGHIK